jgi:hypothetical protein
MTTGSETTFKTSRPLSIATNKLTAVPLTAPIDGSEHVGLTDVGIVFHTPGWYEVLMAVEWDPAAIDGTRFSHTKIPGQEPLHSEAINAAVLAQLSGGRQLLRGNTLFGPDRTTRLVLEVWQDSGQPVAVRSAEIIVRELRVPWRDDQ